MKPLKFLKNLQKRSEFFQSDQAFFDLIEPAEEINKKEFTRKELNRLEETPEKKMSQVIDLINESSERTFDLLKCSEEIGEYHYGRTQI